MESKIVEVMEEQISVRFTGKINILSTFNRQFLGHLLLINGDLVQASFSHHQGLKAFYQLIIQEYSLQSFDYVIEPETIEERERKIHYPFSVIKNKMQNVLKAYRESLKFRPPENVKIIIDSEFLEDSSPVTQEEFDVLSTLTEWSRPSDVYQYSHLLDHEITIALVSLRKKGALKILAAQQDS